VLSQQEIRDAAAGTGDASGTTPAERQAGPESPDETRDGKES
jgi:hypothetical protein